MCLTCFLGIVAQSPSTRRSGSAVANAISQYSLAVILFVYINVRGLHRTTWDGELNYFSSLRVLLSEYCHSDNSFGVLTGVTESSCCLPGWSGDSLQDWGPFLYLAFPSMLMYCLEWWLYEIAGFLAGAISEVELGAQSIIYELATIAYMVNMVTEHILSGSSQLSLTKAHVRLN